MDEDYRRIFSDLYAGIGFVESPNSIVYRSRERNLEASMRQVIDSSAEAIQRDTGVQLRSDAKYFLLLNFMSMLAAPIVIGSKEDPVYLLNSASHDVELLVRDAAENLARQAKERLNPSSSPEVSVHRIVDSLSKNWAGLKLSNIRIWDGSDGG